MIRKHSSRGATITRAECGDAEAICGLYAQAYARGGDDGAERNYPFPQLLDPDWVRQSISGTAIFLLAAKCDGRVAGATGAVRNIGSPCDRVSECFGLVVHEGFRKLGVGARLFAALTGELADESEFIIAETRTAESGGWRIVRECGFMPIGLAPFAHRTPAGDEGMLLTARVSARAMNGVTRGDCLTPRGEKLRRVVLSASCAVEPGERSVRSGAALPRREGGRVEMRAADSSHIDAFFQGESRHGSGVVAFNRLCGCGTTGVRRFETLVARGGTDGDESACALLTWDHVDHRVRLFAVSAESEAARDALLTELSGVLERRAAGERLVVVVDACSRALDLHMLLERLGFFPTAYYPGLIAGVAGREDAIQYTRILNVGFTGTGDTLGVWAEADRIRRLIEPDARRVDPSSERPNPR
ncbi:MAG: GNAT family N-acetyltransferase [Phycisphaerales bacterium]|nr:GNAT family N-acetyltransferase [Phycisphaerales bacterium]